MCFIILGIDPGFCKTGFGVISLVSGKITYIDSGVIFLKGKDRLLSLKNHLESIILRYNPSAFSIESILSAKNLSSTIKLATVFGVSVCTALENNLQVSEYQSLFAKKSLTNSGLSDKKQIISAVGHYLNICVGSDAADALCLSICRAKQEIAKELSFYNISMHVQPYRYIAYDIKSNLSYILNAKSLDHTIYDYIAGQIYAFKDKEQKVFFDNLLLQGLSIVLSWKISVNLAVKSLLTRYAKHIDKARSKNNDK